MVTKIVKYKYIRVNIRKRSIFCLFLFKTIIVIKAYKHSRFPTPRLSPPFYWLFSDSSPEVLLFTYMLTDECKYYPFFVCIWLFHLYQFKVRPIFSLIKNIFSSFLSPSLFIFRVSTLVFVSLMCIIFLINI